MFYHKSAAKQHSGEQAFTVNKNDYYLSLIIHSKAMVYIEVLISFPLPD